MERAEEEMSSLSDAAFYRDVIRELWERLAERYEEARREASCVEWAARAIKQAPESYSTAERLSWACRAVWLIEDIETLERLWQVVCEADGKQPGQSPAARQEHGDQQWSLS